MRVGMTYDLKTQHLPKSGDPPDANAEFDHPSTIQVIQEAIEANGHTTLRIGHAQRLLKELDRLEVDLVFNIAEGTSGRNRESQVPVLLQMKGIPYVGSDGLTQALTLDKLMAKKIFLSDEIPTPAFFQMSSPEDPLPKGARFPAIVKPRYEGSSKGLSERSRVVDEKSLRAQAAWVIENYQQPALVEEFVRGNEFTVLIIGNHEPKVFPPVQISIDGETQLGDLFYTFSRIASGADYVCPARIDQKLEAQLQTLALQAYQSVDCLDFGRVDFRVDEQGRPFCLEVNPLPSLSTEDVFGALVKHCGVTYEALIGQVLDAAIQRQESLQPRESKPAEYQKT